MKPLGKTSDGVMDNLLRAYVSRSADPSQKCPEFDPDLANAYIEHSLPSGARSRYENHLSECGACRKNVVALAKMSDIPASVSPVRERATWLSGARRVLGAMSRPQWAMATVAMLVLAISLPVILTRNAGQQSDKAVPSVAAGSPSVPSPEPQKQADQVRESFDGDSKNAAIDSLASPASPKRRDSETGSAGAEANTRTAGAAGVVASVTDQASRAEQKNLSAQAEDAQKKSVNEVAQAPAAAQVAGSASTAAKSDSEESRSKKQEKDTAQPAPEPRPGRVDEPRDKERLAKTEDVAPPPAAAPSPDADRSRSGLRRAPKLALRESAGAGESVRSNERKINKKDFFFRDNTWTDKDYDPTKDLPVVTIIRDSNVYKELLAKRAGLRPYLESFAENQRAIIVFKGTVYKLIPQK